MPAMFLFPLFLLSITAKALSAHRPDGSSTSCNHFAKSLSLHRDHATVLNSTFFPRQSYNVSKVTNSVAFCELYVSVAYTTNDSLIFAIWLPNSNEYQQRFMAVGDGGLAGVIDTANMLTQLNQGLGLAVAGGDAGHLAQNNNNGSGLPGVYLPFLHDPAQVRAWIHNAISIFTPAARAIVQSYYGQRPKYSYYSGCSTGGGEGYSLVHFHPDLYDGIYAGSPGNYYSHLILSFLWNAQKTNTSSTQLSQAALNFTTNAVLDACDKLDGVADRVIENPLGCHFDVNSLACGSVGPNVHPFDNVTCLTPDELSALKAIYAGPKRSDNGAQIYPGFSFGSESDLILQEGPLAQVFSIPILQNLVYDDLNYNANSFNYASDVDVVGQKAGKLIDANSSNLQAFHKRRGKLITTQGWADPLNAALWPIQLLDAFQKSLGDNLSDTFRLFMAPGGGHCGPTPVYPQVPGTYNTTFALVEWVEKGIKPKQILSTRPLDGSNTTRKLCPWPQTAKYVKDSINNWTSYVCK